MKRRELILDASVIAKWFFPEENSEIALKIKDDFISGKVSIIVPHLLYYEVNNILKTAVKKFRIDPEIAYKAYSAFLELNIISYSTQELMNESLKIAVHSDISSYDASYVALANYLNIPLYTSDKKLIRNAKNKLVKDISS